MQSLCDDECDSRSADILLHSQSGSTVVVSAFENTLFSYRCWWSLMAAPIILHRLAIQSWFSNLIIMIHLQSTSVLLTLLPVCFQWIWNCNVSYRGMLHLVTFYSMFFSDPESFAQTARDSELKCVILRLHYDGRSVMHGTRACYVKFSVMMKQIAIIWNYQSNSFIIVFMNAFRPFWQIN